MSLIWNQVILFLPDAPMTQLARTKRPTWVSFFYSRFIYHHKLNNSLKFSTIVTRCTGSTYGDEMCNLYLMYYTDAKI